MDILKDKSEDSVPILESKLKECEIISPNPINRPKISNVEQAKILTEELYDFHVLHIQERCSYDDKNYYIKVKPTFINENRLKDFNYNGYIMKITNSLDSGDLNFIKAQTELMVFLGSKRYPLVPEPFINKNSNYYSFKEIQCDGVKTRHAIRLFGYIPGILFTEIKDFIYPLKDVYYDLGLNAGLLNMHMTEFKNDVFRQRKCIWHFHNSLHLLKYINYVKDSKKRKMIQDVMKTFNEKVMNENGGAFKSFKKGLIHGDLNDANILMEYCFDDKNDCKQLKLAGILDFGDCHYSAYVMELAILITYTISPNHFEMARFIVDGYHKVFPLSRKEYEHLPVVVFINFIWSSACAELIAKFTWENLGSARTGSSKIVIIIKYMMIYCDIKE